MKNEKVFQAMEHIDSDIINEADTYKGTKKKNIRVKWGAMVACLCLVLVGVFGINSHFENKNLANDCSVDNNRAISNKSKTPVIDDAGLCIPALELPDMTDGVKYDMIGLVVYNGGIYTETEMYYGDEALKIDNLIGDYLGYATGSIGERSTQEEYAEEFASSVAGKVYEVIGYDTDFRVCIREEVEYGNGEKQLWIQFLDRLNGITLTTGEDLFETRLHLRDRIANIQWQSHDDRNYNRGNIQNAVLDANLWERFLNEVDKGTFVNLGSHKISSDTICDTEEQAHIILTMEDGTVARLHLIEGGYVGYDALGWYFVQIPGETFDAVFTACGGNK